MVQYLVDLHPLGPVFDQELLYEVLPGFGYILPDSVAERDLLVDSLASDLFIILTVEGQVPAEHEVDDDAERPAVDAVVVVLLEKDLRGNVAKRAVWLSAGLTRAESP